MKKLLLLAAFGLFASPALAQNTASTSSTGSNNTVDVDQSGSNSATVTQGQVGTPANDNAAIVQQLGTSNTAEIEQTGSNNEGAVVQGRFNAFTGTATGNQATVTQSGSDNTGNFGAGDDGAIIGQGYLGGTATDAVAEVTQSGSGGQVLAVQGVRDATTTRSEATIEQGGFNNIAVSRQGEFAGSSSTGDDVLIRQLSGGQDNFALVTQGRDQSSSNSEAIVVQGGSFDVASVDQGGDNQFVRVLQGDSGGTSSFNSATVSQVDGGAGNAVYLDQGTSFFGGMVSASGNDASVVQNGVDNQVNIEQGTDLQSSAAYATVMNSEATASQTGNESFILIAQGGDSQRGDIAQTGNSNDARLFQIGSDHVVLLDQTGGGIANILQDGNGSAVVGIGSDLVSGTLLRAQSTGGSTLDVDQFGDGNVLFLDQNNGGTATVMQDGMTNTATVVQN